MNAALIRYGIAAVALVAALVGAYFKGYSSGEDHKQAEWNADKLQLAAAQKLADEAQQKRFDQQAADHRKNNLEVSNEHQAAVDKLRADLARARADVRAAGGLRIPVSVCAGAAEGRAEAGGDGRHDADAAATVALPESIENDLLELAAEADRVTEVARACQAWVRKQGFYSPAPAPIMP